MTKKTRITILMSALVLGSLIFVSLIFVSTIFVSTIFVSPVRAEGPTGKKDSSSPTAVQSYGADEMRVQGELRYRANCGRCHAAPRKFPPRMMATVLRHMRVRATITDEDMRLVLFYMSQ